jgi:outer membrane protein insertion porin family
VCGIGLALLSAGVAHAEVISSVVVKGNARVEAATIRNYVLIKPGKSFSAADIDAAVKALYDTGLFADVTINRSGGTLIVKVVENPVVNSVIFKGAKKIKPNILITLVETKARGVLTDAKVQGDAQRLRDYYSRSGRSLASVDPVVTQLPDNRVDVAFVIREGARTGIGSITIVGNSAFSDSRLKSVIVSRQHNLLSWLNRKDVFDTAKLDADQEALRRFYMSHGYADFRVVSVDHQFNEARGRYTVTFTIEEGSRYRFASINIDSSMPGVNTARLRSIVKARPGGTFNAGLVEKSIEDLTIELSREGYSFAQVRPRGDRDYTNHTIAVTFLIDEGARVYVERINVIGNTKTRDYVIRREFDFSEGDPYNRVLVDKAERRLRDLDYFKSVAITTEPGSAPDKVIVNVLVEDQATGDFSVSAGIATTGLVAEVSLNEKNFLGRGQQLRISVGYGQGQQTYNVSFTDPYFLGYRISFGIDAFRNQYSASSYRPFDQTTTGGGLRLGFPITDNLNVLFNYKLIDDTIANTRTASAAFFPNGTTFTSSAGYQILYSNLDSQVDPRDGLRVAFNQDFAGLGGDTQFVRSTADARYYRTLFPDADIVGFVKVAGGNITGIGQPVRAADNFYKGGETIRGFAPYGFGPRIATSDAGNFYAVGGKNFVAATAEVQFPIPALPPDFGLRGAVFADAGTMFGVDVPAGAPAVNNDKSIRSSVGGSVLWASPIGLLRADFAYVLTKAVYDKTQWFRFSAGKQF